MLTFYSACIPFLFISVISVPRLGSFFF
jgi:hypothetical protein